MPTYTIVEVSNKRDLKRFIKFPDWLYRNCPQYVPALHSDQMKSLTKVSTLSYCKRKMWLALDGEKVVGRICGMINPRYNDLYCKKRARFGWFDTIEDIEVARLLLSTAEAWAKENGMNEIHGPLYYNTLGKQGMLVEGFENIPPFNCLYNFPYYNDFVTKLGYEKECDWVQFKMIGDQDLAQKIYRVAYMLLDRYKLHEGNVERLKKDKGMVEDFFKVYNESFASSVYNFVPLTPDEVREEAASFIPFISKKTSVIIMDENEELAGFGITIPSISKALQKAKGRLFPFGWIHLLRALWGKNDTTDLLINGAAPKWQNTGISAVYHAAMSERYKRFGIHWSISNPQIEFNSAANAWNKYDNEPYMRRRCYVKSI